MGICLILVLRIKEAQNIPQKDMYSGHIVTQGTSVWSGSETFPFVVRHCTSAVKGRDLQHSKGSPSSRIQDKEKPLQQPGLRNEPAREVGWDSPRRRTGHSVPRAGRKDPSRQAEPTSAQISTRPKPFQSCLPQLEPTHLAGTGTWVRNHMAFLENDIMGSLWVL